jgi:magnesium transporter
VTEVVNEIFLSTILGLTVINTAGEEQGKLADLVMTPGKVFPEVSHLLVKTRGGIVPVPWKDVSLFNSYVISVSRPLAGIRAQEPREGEIFIKRDILDKQIVDVNGAKVVRVNDVKIGNYEGLLCLFSVDVGFRGLLRRLGVGYLAVGEKVGSLLGKKVHEQEIAWHYVQPLDRNLSRLALTMAQDQMSEMHPADIAGIISQLPHHHAQSVLISLDTETAGEALHELEPELRSRIISQLDSEQASDILEEMDPDEAADVLGDLPEEKAQELLGLMDSEEAEDIQELMEHEEDSAGGLMNSEFVRVAPEATATEAMAVVRSSAEEIDTIYYAYVLDAEERLLGVVSLKELLVADPASPVTDLLTENVKTVGVDAEPEDILEIIAKYNLVAVPVLDEEGKMAGIVAVDDILELFLPYALKRRRHYHH